MPFLRFRILFFIFTASAGSFAFESKECIESKFKASIERKGELFGLLPYEFVISKSRCKIDLIHRTYWRKNFSIDICREPIHLKFEQFNSLNIYKKEGSCRDQSKPFCNKIEELKAIVQDDGLIFAEGERDQLSSEHGQVYCSFLLIKKYLDQSVILSMGKSGEYDLFSDRPRARIAKKIEVETIQEEETSMRESSVKKEDLNTTEASSDAPDSGEAIF
jgi:hypothetical protein